jgi:Transposase, Mutator family
VRGSLLRRSGSRPLHHTTFPYVFLDVTYLHVHRSGQVTSMAVLVATGVTVTWPAREASHTGSRSPAPWLGVRHDDAGGR